MSSRSNRPITTACACAGRCTDSRCALYGAGGICATHGVYDGFRCPNCASSSYSEIGDTE